MSASVDDVPLRPSVTEAHHNEIYADIIVVLAASFFFVKYINHILHSINMECCDPVGRRCTV